jgi:phage tail-like protein
MVVDKGPDGARTDCTLELLDYDGSAIATYTITQAWPLKYSGVSMNAGSNEIAVEGITLAHEGFKRM